MVTQSPHHKHILVYLVIAVAMAPRLLDHILILQAEPHAMGTHDCRDARLHMDGVAEKFRTGVHLFGTCLRFVFRLDTQEVTFVQRLRRHFHLQVVMLFLPVTRVGIDRIIGYSPVGIKHRRVESRIADCFIVVGKATPGIGIAQLLPTLCLHTELALLFALLYPFEFTVGHLISGLEGAITPQAVQSDAGTVVALKPGGTCLPQLNGEGR